MTVYEDYDYDLVGYIIALEIYMYMYVKESLFEPREVEVEKKAQKLCFHSFQWCNLGASSGLIGLIGSLYNNNSAYFKPTISTK